MPKLLDVRTNVSNSSESEVDHALNALSLQVNASADDLKIDNNASHDSTNIQSNFTEVSINSRSAELTGDTENEPGRQSGARKSADWGGINRANGPGGRGQQTKDQILI